MEGPSLVIACEEFKPYLKKKIKEASGSANLEFDAITGAELKKAESWGKHLLLTFSKFTLRIHFLMFGSYRINNPRENRIPKLQLDYGDDQIYFYSCAIKELPKHWRKEYDWSLDLMSSEWSPAQALKKIKAKPTKQVADLLMDQNIFSGLGNIMKNETLFMLRMHPETKIEDLSPARQKALVKASEDYAWMFYEWKKKNVLKRNWQIMRKKKCPICGGKVTKKATGQLKRFSHYCPRCQKKGL